MTEQYTRAEKRRRSSGALLALIAGSGGSAAWAWYAFDLIPAAIFAGGAILFKLIYDDLPAWARAFLGALSVGTATLALMTMVTFADLKAI